MDKLRNKYFVNIGCKISLDASTLKGTCHAVSDCSEVIGVFDEFVTNTDNPVVDFGSTLYTYLISSTLNTTSIALYRLIFGSGGYPYLIGAICNRNAYVIIHYEDVIVPEEDKLDFESPYGYNGYMEQQTGCVDTVDGETIVNNTIDFIRSSFDTVVYRCRVHLINKRAVPIHVYNPFMDLFTDFTKWPY